MGKPCLRRHPRRSTRLSRLYHSSGKHGQTALADPHYRRPRPSAPSLPSSSTSTGQYCHHCSRDLLRRRVFQPCTGRLSTTRRSRSSSSLGISLSLALNLSPKRIACLQMGSLLPLRHTRPLSARRKALLLLHQLQERQRHNMSSAPCEQRQLPHPTRPQRLQPRQSRACLRQRARPAASA